MEWSNFLVAVAGASAALAGLVFVALSTNLAWIIELPGVSGRAVGAIASILTAIFSTWVLLAEIVR